MNEDEDKSKPGKEAASQPDGERLGRRLFFFRVATILSGATMIGTTRRARAESTSDSDTGDGADPPGKGRGRRSGGQSGSNTDSDWGPDRDPVGSPRQRAAPVNEAPGVTDSDSGANADKPGKGRGKSKNGK
jgi:hypothetical protein